MNRHYLVQFLRTDLKHNKRNNEKSADIELRKTRTDNKN